LPSIPHPLESDGFGGTGRTKGFHPTPLARLVSGGHTRFVVGLVLKVVSPQSRRG